LSARRIPLDERLGRAGQLVVRSRKFFDLWFCLQNATKCDATLDVMDEFSELFRFTIHAHFVAFVVHIAALFERKDTINLRRLTDEMNEAGMLSTTALANVEALLCQATPVASKVAILRHNLFAPRSASMSYSEAFEKAGLTTEQLANLTEMALKIANALLLARKLPDQFFHPGPREHAEALLRTLRRACLC
jgi:hypothetical protein